MSGWIENENDLKPVLEGSYLLREAVPVSDMITELCRRGLQAMENIESKQKPSEEWRKATADLIATAEKPQAEMLVAIVPAVKRLVEAASGL